MIPTYVYVVRIKEFLMCNIFLLIWGMISGKKTTEVLQFCPLTERENISALISTYSAIYKGAVVNLYVNYEFKLKMNILKCFDY